MKLKWSERARRDLHATHAYIAAAGTAPEDFREGLGTGEGLLPVSLFEAQLARRLSGGK